MAKKTKKALRRAPPPHSPRKRAARKRLGLRPIGVVKKAVRKRVKKARKAPKKARGFFVFAETSRGVKWWLSKRAPLTLDTKKVNALRFVNVDEAKRAAREVASRMPAKFDTAGVV